jgi:hypothetical protein
VAKELVYLGNIKVEASDYKEDKSDPQQDGFAFDQAEQITTFNLECWNRRGQNQISIVIGIIQTSTFIAYSQANEYARMTYRS